MDTGIPAATQRQFPCKQCGANLQFAPGTYSLVCAHCGTANEIPESAEIVQELDFLEYLDRTAAEAPTEERLAVKCSACGAETTFGPNVVADRCPFCGSAIVAQAGPRRLIRPGGLLPFHVTRDQAMDAFSRWLRALWFAPNTLVKHADSVSPQGVYMPCWTYDCQTVSDYTGQRGEDYWTTETYTTVVNGRRVTRTRTVRRTRWWPVAGRVVDRFDDVLVLASRSLPRQYAEALEPWDLKSVIPYGDEYLAGFVSETYQIDLPAGFEEARQIMAPHIETSIRRDIGGDHQRIDSVRTRYNDITFKHVLLPVWLSAYRYHDRAYRFLVNARTGEVQGERPYSAIKITLAAALALIVMAILVYLFAMQ